MSNNVFPDVINANITSPLEVSDRGGVGIPVYVQDQTTDMLDLLFLESKTSDLLLGVDTVIDDRFIILAAGHGLTNANSAGHILEVSHTLNNRFYQGEIIDITGDTVTLAPPMSDVFTVAESVVSTGNPNMCEDTATGVPVDGSVTPAIFAVKPLPSQSGDITRILFAITSKNEPDLSVFGGAEALAVGMTLRVKRADGSYKNLYTYRSNFDFAVHGFDTATFTPKGGNATYGFGARVTFAGQSKHGVAVRLDGALGEELQIVIFEEMDNTGSGNLTVQCVAEGSELQS